MSFVVPKVCPRYVPGRKEELRHLKLKINEGKINEFPSSPKIGFWSHKRVRISIEKGLFR